MKTTEEKLKNFTAITSDFPCLLLEDFIKKELTDKDCYYLRYCLMRFVLVNQERIWDYIDTDSEKLYFYVDDEASICDDSLCIGNFEGYQISETESIRTLELSIENRAILGIYNNISDSYKYYLID